MLSKLRAYLKVSNVLAAIALFVALGGGGVYAATQEARPAKFGGVTVGNDVKVLANGKPITVAAVIPINNHAKTNPVVLINGAVNVSVPADVIQAGARCQIAARTVLTQGGDLHRISKFLSDWVRTSGTIDAIPVASSVAIGDPSKHPVQGIKLQVSYTVKRGSPADCGTLTVRNAGLNVASGPKGYSP